MTLGAQGHPPKWLDFVTTAATQETWQGAGVFYLTHQPGLPLQGSIPQPFFVQKGSQPFQAASDSEVPSTDAAPFLFSPSPPCSSYTRPHPALIRHLHHPPPPPRGVHASSPHPHLPESCLFPGRWKCPSFHSLSDPSELEQVTALAEPVSSTNRAIIAVLHGYLEDGKSYSM